MRFLRRFSQYSLGTVSIVVTVFSESTVVSICFHTFQLQLCCTVTDGAAAAVLAQDRVHVSKKHFVFVNIYIYIYILSHSSMNSTIIHRFHDHP